ncbi:Hypothetical predicted protein [Lecanosticta acicola]|uniref:Uncharacterized protein n=1 Tax=Lecanosticta acicola TaxID=111012 RepID=A0AAI8YYH7_9PEZI|nr:Hypothetical predicted protein [Lecanosticta acicola]
MSTDEVEPTLLSLPRELRDKIYTFADEVTLVYKNNSTGERRLVDSSPLCGANKQLRLEYVQNCEELSASVKKHHTTIDVDYHEATYSGNGLARLGLFELPPTAEILTITLNIRASVATPREHGYQNIATHLINAIQRLPNLVHCTITTTITGITAMDYQIAHERRFNRELWRARPQVVAGKEFILAAITGEWEGLLGWQNDTSIYTGPLRGWQDQLLDLDKLSFQRLTTVYRRTGTPKGLQILQGVKKAREPTLVEMILYPIKFVLGRLMEGR